MRRRPAHIALLPHGPPEPGSGYWPYETREELAAALAAEYRKGATIRDLIKGHGICFGTVQRLLREGGAVMRPRGDTRRLTRS